MWRIPLPVPVIVAPELKEKQGPTQGSRVHRRRNPTVADGMTLKVVKVFGAVGSGEECRVALG